MTDNFANAGIFLIQTFASLYIILILLRFLMQASRVNFYNPICQAIVKLTDPPIKPLKRLLPAFRGVDFASLVVALFAQIIAVCLIQMLRGYVPFHPTYIAWSMVGLASTILDIYFFSLIVMVIASWIAPQANHPAMELVMQLTEPLCAPARKLLPPMGGLDFSIILIFVAITLIDTYLVVKPLAYMLQIPPGLMLGV